MTYAMNTSIYPPNKPREFQHLYVTLVSTSHFIGVVTRSRETYCRFFGRRLIRIEYLPLLLPMKGLVEISIQMNTRNKLITCKRRC